MIPIKALLLGYGEVGRGLYSFFSQYHAIEVSDILLKDVPEGKFDVLLVAIPPSPDFVDTVNRVRREHCIKATIIFSSVPIGTTSQIPGAVHSPVEGKHPALFESIRLMRRWVGGYNKTVENFFKAAGVEPIFVDKPEFTEFIKLRSTSLYGVNIEFARYTKGVCDELGMPYELVNQFDRDYNTLYQELGMPRFSRYILYPPEGNIKGHCIRENSIILDAQYPSIFLKEIYRDKEVTP